MSANQRLETIEHNLTATQEALTRLTGITESLAASVAAHDHQIEALITVGETHDRRIQSLITLAEKHEKAIANLEQQWQAYLRTLPRQ